MVETLNGSAEEKNVVGKCAESSLERNGRKVLTTIQRIPPKFDHKKILKVIKKVNLFRLASHTDLEARS